MLFPLLFSWRSLLIIWKLRMSDMPKDLFWIHILLLLCAWKLIERTFFFFSLECITIRWRNVTVCCCCCSTLYQLQKDYFFFLSVICYHVSKPISLDGVWSSDTAKLEIETNNKFETDNSYFYFNPVDSQKIKKKKICIILRAVYYSFDFLETCNENKTFTNLILQHILHTQKQIKNFCCSPRCTFQQSFNEANTTIILYTSHSQLRSRKFLTCLVN